MAENGKKRRKNARDPATVNGARYDRIGRHNRGEGTLNSLAVSEGACARRKNSARRYRTAATVDSSLGQPNRKRRVDDHGP